MPDEPNDPVLPYASRHHNPSWTTLHSFFSEIEAQLVANELDARSIRSQIMNGNAKNTLQIYGSMVKVDLQVPSDQLEEARAVFAGHLGPQAQNLLEPAEADDASQPKASQDLNGLPILLMAVASFESAREMQDAALLLEAGRVEPYLPRLVSRGAAAAGMGKRFVLRVEEDDLPRATQLLAGESSEDDEEDENASDEDLKCPRCGAWNVFEIKHELANMVLSLVGKSKPEQCECLKCKYVGVRDEFTRGQQL